MKMNGDEYIRKMKQIAALGQLSLSIDARELIPMINSMESVGPLLDPTAFVKQPRAFDRLAAQKELAEAVAVLSRVFAKHVKIEAGTDDDTIVQIMRAQGEVGWMRLELE